jgi:hypothetical protein
VAAPFEISHLSNLQSHAIGAIYFGKRILRLLIIHVYFFFISIKFPFGRALLLPLANYRNLAFVIVIITLLIQWSRKVEVNLEN